MTERLRRLPLALSITLVLASTLLVACGGGDNETTTTPTQAPAAAVSVSTMDNSYSPAAMTARAGQKVTVNLKNDGQQPHTFTIDTVVDSGQLTAGQSKTIDFTPSQAGTLTYYCTVHGQAAMSGTVTVSASGTLPVPADKQPET